MERPQPFEKPYHGARIRRSLPALAFLCAASCVHDNGEDRPSGSSGTVHGTLLVSLVEEFPPYWDRHAAVSGRLYDGPSPLPVDWRERAASGPCRVLTPEAPFCDGGCGSAALCSVGGVCTAFPGPVHAGKITVSGIRTASGAMSFVMNPVLDVYQPSGLALAAPPYAEGDLLTFTAAGAAAAPAFSLSARGPSLPTLLNDSIILDGNPILLRWTPPGPGAGPSILLASLDISHHGGIKGIIECVAEDDGELEIAGSLVNELKALGVSGYPQIDLVRRTTATLEGHGLSLVLEARVLRYVTVPGLTSCREDEDCPVGQSCRDDFKCQ
jgi:hypothetical protein